MNLIEVTSEFDTPKTEPKQDLIYLEKRQKAIDQQLKYSREEKERLQNKIVGKVLQPNWDEADIDNPGNYLNIEKRINSGYTPVTMINHWNGKKQVIHFIPSIPENKEVIGRLQRLLDRESKLSAMRNDMPTLVKRAKTRLSAWKRKQSNYIPKDLGRELLAALKERVEQFIVDKNLQTPINNSYYWAKNKMVVIELAVKYSDPGKTIFGTASVIKIMVDKWMTEQGYTMFRVTDRKIDDRLSIVKIQLDDADAKNKAITDETE